MDSDFFVEEFISQCVDEDIASPKDICAKAVKRVDEITEALKGHNALRVELRNLNKVLRHFNHDSVKRKRKKRTPAINPNLATSDMEPSFIEQLAQICSFVDSSDDPVTPRNIMDGVGDIEEHTEVYVAIKWLCENGILKRNEDRSLIKGEKWDERPTEETEPVEETG
jgi:hypothetical protein